MSTPSQIRAREWLDAQKARPCADCGGVFPPCVMDFDHVRGEKKFTVGYGLQAYGRRKVKEEMLKCDLVCSNCHRIRTYITRKKG